MQNNEKGFLTVELDEEAYAYVWVTASSMNISPSQFIQRLIDADLQSAFHRYLARISRQDIYRRKGQPENHLLLIDDTGW